MVARLADADEEGRLRRRRAGCELVRSYRVLDQDDKMEAAVADARKALAGDAGKLARFEGSVEAGEVRRADDGPDRWRPERPAPPAQGSPRAAEELDRSAMVARLAERLKKDGSDVAWLGATGALL